jgi:hypothetical protein
MAQVNYASFGGMKIIIQSTVKKKTVAYKYRE